MSDGLQEFLTLLGIGAGLYLSWQMYTHFYEEVCVQERTVARVLSCTPAGPCAVNYWEGGGGQEMNPSPGQVVCAEWAWRRK